jgi:hypothetical protein
MGDGSILSGSKKSVAGRLAAVAVVSIPVAAAIGVVIGGRALYRRFHRPETDEEKAERLQAAYREYPEGL